MNWIDNLWKVYRIEPYFSEYRDTFEGEWDGYYVEAKTIEEAIDLRVSFPYGCFVAIPMGWDYPQNVRYVQSELF